MNLIASLNALDRRYGWSLLGFILATIFGSLTLYTEFLRDTRPELRFELTSDTSVLDVREPLGDLAIMYGGSDIRAARQSLRVLLVRITNSGLQDILRGHYDDRTPVGFRVLNGALLRVQVLSATNQYISDTQQVEIRDGQAAVLTPIILESQEGFVLKCLVLSPEDSRPKLEPFGKVAGVRRIALIDSTQSEVLTPFWVTAFSGALWVQLARLIVYFTGLILLVTSVIVPVASIGSALSKRRRRIHIKRFKAIHSGGLEPRDEFIFDSYVSHGTDFLRRMQAVISDEQRLNRQPEILRLATEKDNASRQGGDIEHSSSGEGDRLEVVFSDDDYHEVVFGSRSNDPSFTRHRLMWRVPVRQMAAAGLIVQEGNRWVPDGHMKATLDSFLGFLKANGVYSAA